MTGRAAGATALAAVLTLGACGTTYVDESVEPRDTVVPTTTTTLPPVATDADLDDLLAEIQLLMSDLDQVIVDDDLRAIEVWERIDELWTVAEQQIRSVDPDDVYNFEQAIELARSGATRRRPADASKGSKILADVVDAYSAG